MAFSWFLRKRKRSSAPETMPSALSIILRVESGLLMAFGPNGDPLPPDLVHPICAADPGDKLQMETGHEVDRRRVLAILDAQQQGPLANQRDSRWIRAMLGLEGGFEETPFDLLAAEPAGPTPPAPDVAASDVEPGSAWLTPLAFEKAETKSMAGADVVLVHGLREGMRLSRGRFEPRLNGWVVRPHQLSELAVQRADGADDSVTIDVTAVSVQGAGNRWPITSRQMSLA